MRPRTKGNSINYWHYADASGSGIVRIKSWRRPSISSKPPRGGTWVVEELKEGQWIMPPLPEVTWGTLKKLIYIGSQASYGRTAL